MGILAKVLLIGFAAFWALGILLYVTAPMLWRFVRHRLRKHDQRMPKAPDRLPEEGPGTGRGDPNHERR